MTSYAISGTFECYFECNSGGRIRSTHEGNHLFTGIYLSYFQMTVFISGSTCPYTYDVIEDLQGKNVTQEEAIAWPCELRTYWIEILPLVKLVRFLLSYGTATIVMFGVCLNVLSFIVLTQKYMRKTTSNLYLAFLAVYDTCSLLFNFMIGVIRGNNESANKNFQVIY